jgi:chromosome segregation ATPase
LVQSVLLFALGFLAAAFLAFLFAPAIWQRAVHLTKKRIEASVPLTLNEVQADKDQQRAEFALSTRKLEINVKSLKEKVTTQQIDVTRVNQELALMAKEREQLNKTIDELQSQAGDMNATLQQRAIEVATLETKRSELELLIEARLRDVEEREHAIRNLTIEADNRRIELVAQSTAKEQLAGQVTEIRQVRHTVEQKLRSTANELRAAQEAARADRRKIADFEKKHDRLVAQLTDREEKLERRERELVRFRDSSKQLAAERTDFEKKLNVTERQRASLENQNSGLSERVGKMATIANIGGIEKTMKKNEEERAQLAAQVVQLTSDKKALERQLALITANLNGTSEPKLTEPALREQMHDITAKFVAMSAEIEGKTSPIPALLEAKAANVQEPKDAEGDVPVSLANRIKALQQAARRN